MMDADLIKARFNAAKAKRQPHEAEIHLAYLFTSPMGSPQHTRDQAPDRSSQFDSTAEDALNTLVSAILDNLIPRTQNWISFELSEEWKELGLPSGEKEIFAARNTRKFFNAINGSKFRLATAEAMKDCVISGTGAIGLKIDPTDKSLFYTSIPIRELSYLPNGDGEIDKVFREYDLPAADVVRKFKKAPKWVNDLADKKPDDLVTVVEAMVPSKKADEYEFSTWLSKGWDCLQQEIVKRRPFIVFRWDRSSGSAWGDSPTRKAIADIRSINQMMADTLDAAALTARPPLKTNDPNLEGKAFAAGTTTYVPEGSALEPIYSAFNFAITFELMKEIQVAIRRSLMAQVLPASDRMTVAEVQVHQSEFRRRMSVYGVRLEEEFLEPVVRASISALQATKKMDKFELNDDPYCLVMHSIDKKVKYQQEVDRVMTLWQMISIIPGGTKHLNTVKLGRYLLEQGGMPAEVMNSIEEVEAAIQAEHEMNMLAQGIATMKGQGTPEGAAAMGEAAAAMQNQAT